jgi:Zinc finger, C2H2 type
MMIMNSVVGQNLMLQEPEMYTIESHCSEISTDIDEKPIIDSMMVDDDDLVGSFMPVSDPLDVHDWMDQQTNAVNQQQNEFMTNSNFQIASLTPPLHAQEHAAQDIEMKPSTPPCPYQNYDKCIVCARVFKNPNSLEKHLRNVHTAHIIRPELTTSIKKSSEYRRIVLNKKPIKETVAKALVSKLNKKNQQQNATTVTTENQPAPQPKIEWNSVTESLSTPVLENGNTIIIISNVEITPANSQTTTISNGYTFANYQSQLPKLVPISSGTSYKPPLSSSAVDVSYSLISFVNCCFNFSYLQLNSKESPTKPEQLQNSSPKVFIIDKVVNSNAGSTSSSGESSHNSHPKSLKAAQSPTEEEHHECPECQKVFQKKYQLKRHQEIHENLFYFCPFCKRAPVKARSSLRKHFMKDHPQQQEIWQASNFMSTLLRKYEKTKKSSHESHGSSKNAAESTNHLYPKGKTVKEKKESGKGKKKKEKIVAIEVNNCSSNHTDENSSSMRCEMLINDQPLPQVSLLIQFKEI